MRFANLWAFVCLLISFIGCGGDDATPDVDDRASSTGGDTIATKESGKSAVSSPDVTPPKTPVNADPERVERAAHEDAEAPKSSTSPNLVTNPFQFVTPIAELKDGQVPPLLGEISCSPANDFAISWDGRFVARAGGFSTDMALWRIADGKIEKKLTPHKYHLTSVAFSRDGKHLFASHESTSEANISLWDLATGNLVETKMGHQGVTWQLTCLPDVKTLVSYGGKSNTTVRLWDISSEAKIAEFEVDGPSQGWFSVSADGSLIAAPAGGGDVALLDVAKRSLMRKVNIGKSSPRGVDLVGKSLAVAGGFNEELLIWDLSEDRETHRVSIGKYVRHARFSQDGKLVAVTTDDFIDCSVRIFSVESGERLLQFEPDEDDAVDQIRFHPAAPVMATATGRKIKFWDLRGLKD